MEIEKHQNVFTYGLLACHRSPPDRPGHSDGFNAAYLIHCHHRPLVLVYSIYIFLVILGSADATFWKIALHVLSQIQQITVTNAF
jgi:hypothetical protein